MTCGAISEMLHNCRQDAGHEGDHVCGHVTDLGRICGVVWTDVPAGHREVVR